MSSKDPFPLKKNFHGQKIFQKHHCIKLTIFNCKIFFDGKFVSANHILHNFFSAEDFPQWKWALKPDSPDWDKHKGGFLLCLEV